LGLWEKGRINNALGMGERGEERDKGFWKTLSKKTHSSVTRNKVK
jgi:hypothetical protein